MTTPQEPQTPIVFPPFINGGTTLKVDRNFPNYPNTDWTYTLILTGPSVLSVPATSDPDGYTFHVVATATQTASLTPGNYGYVERLTAADGEVFDVRVGNIVIQPNPATMAAGDGVTHEETALAIIEAAIEGRLTSDQEHYAIAGRSVSKIPIDALVKLRARYRYIVLKQRNRGSLTQSVDVTFPLETPGGQMPPWWRGLEDPYR